MTTTTSTATKFILGFFSAAALASSAAVAAADLEMMATVISARPHYINVQTPSYNNNCYNNAQVAQERGIGGQVVGGLVGAVVGSRIGNGNGRIAATGVGAVAGALIGDAVSNHTNTNNTNNNRGGCTQGSVRESRQEGYEVTLELMGRQFVQIMRTAPVANQIPVVVTVTPRTVF